ncbi:MAG: stalk domain-containing protein [Bacillota bacterium]
MRIWVVCLVFLSAFWPAAAGAESYHRVAVEFISGSKVMTVEDTGNYVDYGEGKTVVKQVEMDVAPEVDDGQVFVPLRYAAEGLRYNVVWDVERKVVVLEQGSRAPDALLNRDPMEDPLLRSLFVPGNPCYGERKLEIPVGGEIPARIVKPGRVLVPAGVLADVLGVRGWEDPEKKTAGLAIDLVSE